MSYVYNSQDDRLDFPNPFRIENIFYFIAAGLLILGGLVSLISSRSALGSGSIAAMTPFVIGLGLLIKGLFFATQAMSRLRFYFGRSQPNSLEKELPPDTAGGDAQGVKDILRHGSLSFQEPTGPLNGVLYSIIPNLIYAPQRIQFVAQRQFQNALAIAITFFSLLLSLIGSGLETRGWLGAFYFGMALFLLLKPLDIGAYGQASLGFKGLIGLILLAILGPVAIPLALKGVALPDWLPGLTQAGIILVTAEGAIALFFLALMKQTLQSPPDASMAMVQGTLTMNSHPKQVQDELERVMQSQWVAQLPNRRYARILPTVSLNQQSGSFRAELLEETQPIPRKEMQRLTLTSCFEEPRYRWLGWLNAYGIAVMFFAIVLALVFSLYFFTDKGLDQSVVGAATSAIALLILGDFCFRAGNVLWGRFDFISKLVWVEMQGNYQAAQMDFGNQFTDRVKTQKQVINIESMTVRVWAAEIESVTFGKDSVRSILGMRGLHQEAEALHAHLLNFGQQQSMIVAPTSAVDVQRAQALSLLNQSSGESANGIAALSGALNQVIGASPVPPVEAPAPSAAPTCANGHAIDDLEASFCSECGVKLLPA